MRHADLAIPRIDPLSPASATRPTAPLGNGSPGAGFGRLFSEVTGEVADYIQHGEAGGGAGQGASALSAEGALLRARASGLIMGAEEMEGAGAAEGALPMGGAGLESPQQLAFLESIAPWARQAAEQLGVAPELVSAHAALESGWGQRPLKTSAGASSHNLFGIKAGPGWNGAVTDSATTEFVNGSAIKTRERFRAYPDPASAFRDYAQMLIDNPRYRGALGVGSDARAFAQGLARGGYATDPGYAAKLTRLAKQLQGPAD